MTIQVPLQSTPGIDAAAISRLSRRGSSVGGRGHEGKQGFGLAPPGGTSMDYPMDVRADCVNLGWAWGAFMRGEGVQDPLPISHYYLEASIITPVTDSFDTPASPVPIQLLFGGERRKRVDPGALVKTDYLGGYYRIGAEAMIRTFIVGEGVLGVLGAAITVTTPVTITGPQLPITHPLYGRSFFIMIDGEAMLISGGTTGTAWVASLRGAYGTAAATHANGASVGHAAEYATDKATAWDVNAWSYDGNQTMNPAPVVDGQAQHYIATPMVMFSERLVDQSLDVVVIIGDSRSQGQGDNRPNTYDPHGFQERACQAAGLPYLKLAAGGTSLTTWTSSQWMEWRMAAEFGGTIASIALGTNAGNETGATLFAQLEAVLDICVALGMKPVVWTIPPRTDPGNAPSAFEPNRVSYNQLIRANLVDDPRCWRVIDGGGSVAADADNNPDPDGAFWGNDATEGILGTDLHDTDAGHAQEALLGVDGLMFVKNGGKGGISTGQFTSSTVPAAPVNTVAPAVSGTTVTGSALNCSNGTWTGYPAPTFGYQWRRDGAAIPGATTSSYLLVSADEGHSVKCTVMATNTQGSAFADSNAVVPTAVPAPTNTVAPAVTGTSTTGNALNCSNGTWTGSPTGFAYQWKRNGVAITGATANVYTLDVADEGTGVKCTVTATNAGGSTPADSNTVSPTSGSVFDPGTLAPAFWIKPRMLDGTLANGADVVSITESSSHARVLASAGPVNPVLTKNVIDGLSVIDFNRTAQSELHIDGTTVAQPFEVWKVFGLSDFPGDHSGGSRQIVWGGQAGTVPYFALTPGDWDDSIPYFITLYAGTAVEAQIAGTNRAAAMAVRLIRTVYDGASSLVERNGVEVMTGDPGTNALLGLYLGRSGGFGQYSNLRLVEQIIVPTRLDSTQRANLLSYFDATVPSLGL